MFDNDRADFIDGDRDLIIQIKGHSLFSKKGTDIVCSAVSALAQTLVFSIKAEGFTGREIIKDTD